MGRQLLQLSIKSLRRRWRQIVRACMVTFLAVFFVTGVLLFQENMYQWQIMSNKERFGDWFVMQTNTNAENSIITEHAYIEECNNAQAAVKLYDKDWDFTKLYVGYMPLEFMNQGHIIVEEGRLPQADNEIAMDWNTLQVLGCSAEIGKKVSINYYDSDNESDEKGRIQEEYTLVGVLRSYTDVWKSGKRLPGALVSQSRYEAFDNNAHNVYIYKLKSDVKTDDYSLIYKNIKKQSGTNPLYNDYLYEYKPWGTESVYNYIYMVIMAIGVAALTYQLVNYRSSRKQAYTFMRNTGATKVQIMSIKGLESGIILIPSAVLGVVVAVLLGDVICSYIESHMSIEFYYVDISIPMKSVICILVAVIIEQIAGKLMLFWDYAVRKRRGLSAKESAESDNKKVSNYSQKHSKVKLKKHNLTLLISSRLIKHNGFLQNAGVRLFSLAVSVIIIVCSFKTYNSYQEYMLNKELPDFVGYQDEDRGSFVYGSRYFYSYDKLEGMDAQESYSALAQRYNYDKSKFTTSIAFTEDIVQDYINGKFGKWSNGKLILDDTTCVGIDSVGCKNSKYVKNGNTNLFEGFSEDFVNKVSDIAGVKDITFSAYESMRSWSWDGMSEAYMAEKKLDIARYEENGIIGPGKEPYCNKYLYATQYINPTEELYERLSKYIDKSMLDYEEFCNGEQVIVFVDKNADDEYDMSIKPGTEIRYQYYDIDTTIYIEEPNPFTGEFLFPDTIGGMPVCGYPYSQFIYENGQGKLYKEIQYVNGKEWACVNLWKGTKEYYRESVEACVTPKAAGVVYLTEDIKDEFKDLIVNYGYYTAIASTKMGEIACERQNDFIGDVLDMELTEETDYDMKYNQLTVTYDLTSSFSATHNILARYCEENNVTFNSLTEEKEVYRTELINSFLQNGVTIIAVIIINVLISLIIAKNRMIERRTRLQLLYRMGAGRKRIRRICMIEAFRESLWCVITMPVVLLVQYILYTGEIRRM